MNCEFNIISSINSVWVHGDKMCHDKGIYHQLASCLVMYASYLVMYASYLSLNFVLCLTSHFFRTLCNYYKRNASNN